MTAMNRSDGCALCRPAGRVIVTRDAWQLTTFPGFDVPGWYFLQSRDHVTSLTELTPTALHAFGPFLRDSVDAIERVTDCEKVYVLRFGETHEHWHVLLAARPGEIPPASRGAQFILDRERYRDSAHASRVALRVRNQLEAH
jgi:diadenosine tetraphosphate (Ap4A) HIT family hydrolase